MLYFPRPYPLALYLIIFEAFLHSHLYCSVVYLEISARLLSLVIALSEKLHNVHLYHIKTGSFVIAFIS